MRWTHKHTGLALLAVAAAILAVAATHPVDPVDTMPDDVGRIGSAIDPSGQAPATPGTPAPSTPRPVITLGNLDPPPELPPPWGPQPADCAVIGWARVVPPRIRPATNLNPSADPPIPVPAWDASTAPSAPATDPAAAGTAAAAGHGAAPRHDRPIC